MKVAPVRVAFVRYRLWSGAGIGAGCCWGRLPAGEGVAGSLQGESPHTVSFFYQSQTLRTKYEVSVLAFG